MWQPPQQQWVNFIFSLRDYTGRFSAGILLKKMNTLWPQDFVVQESHLPLSRVRRKPLALCCHWLLILLFLLALNWEFWPHSPLMYTLTKDSVLGVKWSKNVLWYPWEGFWCPCGDRCPRSPSWDTCFTAVCTGMGFVGYQEGKALHIALLPWVSYKLLLLWCSPLYHHMDPSHPGKPFFTQPSHLGKADCLWVFLLTGDGKDVNFLCLQCFIFVCIRYIAIDRLLKSIWAVFSSWAKI